MRAQNRAIFPQNFIRSFGRLFVGFVEAIKKAPFFISQRAEIYRALAFVREQDETLSCGRDRDLAELMEQVGKSLPEAALRQRDAPGRGTMTMK